MNVYVSTVNVKCCSECRVLAAVFPAFRIRAVLVNNLQEAADVTYIQHELRVMFIPRFPVPATHIAASVRPQEY